MRARSQSESAALVVPSLEHLRALTTPAGVVQFAQGRLPDPASGTCLDDNARAWLVAAGALALNAQCPHAKLIGDRAAKFVTRAQLGDGRFHNFAAVNGQFLDDIGSEDSFGRAIWACGIIARCTDISKWQSLAMQRLEKAYVRIPQLASFQARAYCVLGLSAAVSPELASPLPLRPSAFPTSLRDALRATLIVVADSLATQYEAVRSDDWRWWADSLTWGNGRMPEAMLRAAAALRNQRYAELGLDALSFLASVTQPNGRFTAIGNDGWYIRGGKRALYDQQPIEACAMVDAWLAAYRLTGDPAYLANARSAYEWFNGDNDERLVLADVPNGACFDGLRKGAVNENQGAESTLSYLHACVAIEMAGAYESDAPTARYGTT